MSQTIQGRAVDELLHELLVDSQGRIIISPESPSGSSEPIYKLILDDSTPNITYVGKAALGSATSAAVWQIQKIDETTGMVITWADSAGFTQVWDDRVAGVYA